MKNINEMTVEKLINTTTNQQNGKFSKEDKVLINNTFKRLQGMRPGWRAGFKSKEEIDNYKAELLKGCVARNVNSDIMIEKGLLEALKETGQGSEFMPGVGKFLNWCKPQHHWEHRRIQMLGDVPAKRWLTDTGKKERAIAARDKTMKQYRG